MGRPVQGTLTMFVLGHGHRPNKRPIGDFAGRDHKFPLPGSATATVTPGRWDYERSYCLL
jgi:hypothetical protein